MVPVTTNQMRISQIGGTPIAGWFIMENPLIPICSMYGIFTYIWAIFGVNVGKYSIHGASGIELIFTWFDFNEFDMNLPGSRLRPAYFGSLVASHFFGECVTKTI